MAGYEGQTEASPSVRVAVDKLFEELPRNTSLDCSTFSHDINLSTKARYKDTPVKAASKRVSGRRAEAAVTAKSLSVQADQGPAPTVRLSGEGMQVDEERGGMAANSAVDMSTIVCQTPLAPSGTISWNPPVPTSSGVNGITDTRPGPTPLPSTSASAATSFTTTAAPPTAVVSDFATEQQRWKTTLARIADQYIEAASVSDVGNPDVVRGILAMAIKSSGLKLP